jgi:hypothetical protein
MLVRRWLWERFNVAHPHRSEPPPLAATLWNGDPRSAIASLRLALADLVNDGGCDAANAQAWSAKASLEGHRMPTRDVAARIGLSVRGLDARVRAVDSLLAQAASTVGLPNVVTAWSDADRVIQHLVMTAVARDRGRDNVADGNYSAAAELAGLATAFRIKPVGRDRTVRNRVKSRALAASLETSAWLSRLESPQRSFSPSDIGLPGDQADPGLLLDTLEAAWAGRAMDLVPTILAQAQQRIPSPTQAGRANHLRLLEIASNIFRDAESLDALRWTSLWIAAAERPSGSAVRARVNGHKTRAHVLQLHGFLSAARRELDLAKRYFAGIDPDTADYSLLRTDLAVRSVALDLLDSKFRNARNGLAKLGIDVTDTRLEVMLLRLELYLESASAVDGGRRRPSSGGRRSAYEDAAASVITSLRGLPAPDRGSGWDSTLAAAVRLGDVALVSDSLSVIDTMLLRPLPSVATRLNGRLLAAARMPGTGEILDLRVVVPPHPYRHAALLPRSLRFLL